ncbi:MAG: MoaD/ThiS family protein [Gemmatimonadaceae bacterium]
MDITALLFASYADVLGRDRVQLALAPDATVADALAQILALPGGEQLPPQPLVAVNLAYARRDHRLRAGDEIAVIPPVAGG